MQEKFHEFYKNAPIKRLWVELLLVCFVIAAGISFVMQVHAILRNSTFTDFEIMYRGALAVAHAQSPYDLDAIRVETFGPHYKFPPLFAILLGPFTRFEFRNVVVVWLAISLSFYFVSFLLLARSTSSKFRSLPGYVLAIAFLIFQPSLDTLFGGQLEFLLLLLLTGAYLTAQRAKSGITIAAPLIAFATLLKIYPVLLLADFAIRRWWHAIGIFVAAALVFTLFSALASSWEVQRQFYLVMLPALSAKTAWLENQSFFGFFARLFVNGATVDPYRPANLPTAAVLANIASVLCAGLSFVTLFRMPLPQYSFPVLIPLMLLVAPDAWIHYETILLLPIAILLANFWSQKRWFSLAALSAAFALLAYGNEDNVRNSTFFLLQSYKFFGVLLLWLLGLSRILFQSQNAVEHGVFATS